MASRQFIPHSVNNRVCVSPSAHVVRHRHSKTVTCLHRILRIISSFPPPTESPKSELSSSLRGGSRLALFDVDLNLRFGSPVSPPLETVETECSPENAGAERSSVAECQCDLTVINLLGSGKEADVLGGKALDVSEITATEVPCLEMNGDQSPVVSSKAEEAGEKEHQPEPDRHEGCLHLLVEAVKIISGEFEDSDSEPKQPHRNRELGREFRGKRRTTSGESDGWESKRRKPNYGWTVNLYADLEDTSPIVRTKRGRRQALPLKYRDSVLEPLEPLSRHRSRFVALLQRFLV
ncbi:uncharacterized protein LOC127796567 [Diospyros lotus]|uniref:uncharacterized protein LOC127796567 n=1 Tax=Diospyros lotus TaxID=55363 RepID=UPI00225593F7|nr:uncharacterized protein LOC127796567 [Diospyros lotus]